MPSEGSRRQDGTASPTGADVDDQSGKREDDGGGFFPAASVSLGADARRALRVLRRGPEAASASSRAYPPCVRETLAALHRDRHLRHDARHRLTLFFKGIDMSAEETLAVWRSQLAHGRMTDFGPDRHGSDSI